MPSFLYKLQSSMAMVFILSFVICICNWWRQNECITFIIDMQITIIIYIYKWMLIYTPRLQKVLHPKGRKFYINVSCYKMYKNSELIHQCTKIDDKYYYDLKAKPFLKLLFSSLMLCTWWQMFGNWVTFNTWITVRNCWHINWMWITFATHPLMWSHEVHSM
jgi:hypothetical protein